MATARIFRINYKSDFILTLHSDAGWMTPFCIKFWTGAPSQAYYASFDGTDYTNCAAGEDPKDLTVQFDDHGLPIGDLKFQVVYHFTVADFPNDTEDEVINQANITTEIDGQTYQVMLDFNGETAPEIEFSLPAYANEAQRIENEQTRIANEETRVENEEQRVENEQARVEEYADLKADAVAATAAANDAAALANQKAQLAQQKAGLADDAATLATQKAGLADDAATLATQKAGLANDAAALATQKAGLAGDAATLATQKAGLANDAATLANQKAQYASDQGDYAKAQGDYAKAQAGMIPVDVTRTQTDATFVNGDHNPLFYLRQANSSLAGLMTAAGYSKLNAMPSAQEVNAGLAYDVSVLHPTSGVSGGSTYASLSAAIAVIPQDKRKGGMTVKFVQSYDNNSSQYVQYRYMGTATTGTPNPFTNTANWQGVDDKPTAGSDNLITSGGVEAITSIMPQPDYVGAYKKVITIPAGSSHSSNNDRIKVDIKEGSKFAVYTTVNGESYNGQVFVKYGESSTNVSIGIPNKSYTAEHNISSIGVYFSSVNSDTTVEFTVLVDLLLSIVEDITDAKSSIATNTSNIANLSVYSNKNRKAVLIKGSNVNKITYDNGVVTIPEGLVIRYLENGSLKNYLVPQAVTLAATGYFKHTVWFDTDDKSFYSNGYLNSVTDTMIYVFSFECNAKTSDLPIDLDGTGSRITGIDTSIHTLNTNVTSMKPIVDTLGYELNTSTDSPIALNSGRNIIIRNIRLIKDCIYKVNITITYDTSRAGVLYVGFFKGNTAVTSCAGTWSNSVIRITETSFSAYFVPSESADVGLLSVSNYSYDSENEQYVSATVEVDSIIERLSTVENDISTINGEIDTLDDRVEDLEASDPTTFEGRTLEQRRLAQHLGFGREATWTGDYMPAGWIPQLVFLHISDTHSNSACSNNAITALNLLSTRQKDKGNCAKFLIHTGDIKTENFNSDFTYWTTARANANKPVFHVVGNHDVGFNKEVSTAGTDAQVYASNTEPFISGWDLTTTNQGTPHPEGKNYYFKDFTDEKIRLIVLYEFETDFELDPSDSTKLKYSRPMRAFRQAQIDWLIDSLMKTPSDYGVIIAKHQMEDYVGTDDINFSSYFLRNNTGQDQTFTPRGMIADIVQAFIDATTLNQTYAITGGVVGDIVVNTDFSNKNIGSEFICYLSGHTHLDSIHYLKNYPKQLELTIGCDNTNYTHNSDMAQIANTKSADVINVCSIDRNRGYVYVVRVGSDFTYTAQKRDYVALDYRNHTS